MFSRKMVQQLESVVQDKARKVCKLMQEGIAKGVPVDLHHTFRALSMDVISEYAFNKSYDFLEKEDLGSYFFRMARGIGPALWAFQQLPSVQAAALKIPPWLAPYLSEPLGKVLSIQQECVNQVEHVKRGMAAGKLSDRPTIFSTLLTEEDKPAGYRVPSTMDLKDEAYSVLAAASDTTGNGMTVAAFHIMSNPQIYQSLVRELEKAFPVPNAELPYVELERLPYLVSFISSPFCLTETSNGVLQDRRDKRSSAPLLWRHRTPSPGCSRLRCNIQRVLCPRRHDRRNVLLDDASQSGHLPGPYDVPA
jgi:cytochrome P450